MQAEVAFVQADVAQAVLEIIPDGVAAPIAEVACQVYILSARLASRTLNSSSDWLQAIFTDRASGAYLEGPIRTRLENPVYENPASHLPGSPCHCGPAERLSGALTYCPGCASRHHG